MRRLAAVLLPALLAATALPAAKPLPPEDGAGGETGNAGGRWRGQAIAVCVDRLHAVPDLGPDDLETICRCAADRFLEGSGAAPLPAVEPARLPAMMNAHLIGCTSESRPDQAVQVAQLDLSNPRAPAAAALPPLEASPAGEANEGPAASGERSDGSGFWDWVGTLTLPAWLTGASLLWWIALGIFLFGLLVLKLRRRDPRNDLMGPPAHMRRGAPARPPRRSDLPR